MSSGSPQRAASPAEKDGMRATAAPAQSAGGKTLEELEVTSSFTDELPGDPERKNFLRQVHNAFYSFVAPTPTATEPRLVAGSTEMAREIGLDPLEFERPEFAMIFSGNAQLPGTEGKSYAQCYAGHQFGNWAGQLGDGRAISLGEITGPSGKRWELQLKGAGRTPYSRMADGRAVLRSSIREFLGSEAMHFLGIPTTRALSLVLTGDSVMRDMFYSGDARLEPGAVVCRASPSFVRFGTFQLPASRGGLQAEHLVGRLADYVIQHHYPHLAGAEDRHVRLLREVCERTGRLVAGWQAVGFAHGVLNTDNMSILGETIDYGPYGWMEAFDPQHTPNTTDLPGRRYSFRNQPEIGQWNLAQLANALLAAGLVQQEAAQEAVEAYADVLMEAYNARMAAKLGLRAYSREAAVAVLTAMYEDRADFTNTFRALSTVSPSDAAGSIPAAVRQAIPGELTAERGAAWGAALDTYRAALRAEGLPEDERQALMRGANPAFVPRNHLLQEVIAAAEAGDFAPLLDYYEALKRPYEEQPGKERWQRAAPGVIRRGIEMLSCSS